MSRRAAVRERAASWLRAREAVCDDRGSGAAAVIMFALLFMALAAFVVDGGLSISQRERAADIAEQAARYAAQDIDEEALRASQGNSAPINYENCGARVHEFATRSGLSAADVAASGCVSASAQQVRVRIRLTYRPVLTGLFYSAPLTVHGTATAESVTG
ncbi:MULTISPECIES: pilus assembly protein TadG-related protein [unclassified Streptomyces]|uniref:pilus assembly protein TadG-related protein n=1 Tax=unclassified Streptomyces TaxID=2593676 RepID=UPI0023ED6917|nr:pilus assembly protein TadG-related protein [Streptomyces sp. WMMB303]MDF4250753.1 pilus assembly protein TadG-related protein [Streptomyces sp. WMMB303]